jgi:hypothetical protein
VSLTGRIAEIILSFWVSRTHLLSVYGKQTSDVHDNVSEGQDLQDQIDSVILHVNQIPESQHEMGTEVGQRSLETKRDTSIGQMGQQGGKDDSLVAKGDVSESLRGETNAPPTLISTPDVDQQQLLSLCDLQKLPSPCLPSSGSREALSAVGSSAPIDTPVQSIVQSIGSFQLLPANESPITIPSPARATRSMPILSSTKADSKGGSGRNETTRSGESISPQMNADQRATTPTDKSCESFRTNVMVVPLLDGAGEAIGCFVCLL